MKKGFTLIEMLVVVLIVGILAAIALPQYEAAIEKSRVSEALVVMKALSDAEQRYFQANPNETQVKYARQIADVDLKGGCWAYGKSTVGGDSYRTRNFTYDLGSDGGEIAAYRIDRDELDKTVCSIGGSSPQETDKDASLYHLVWGPESTQRTCVPTDSSDETAVAICNFVQRM